jgi:hypothetical protein
MYEGFTESYEHCALCGMKKQNWDGKAAFIEATKINMEHALDAIKYQTGTGVLTARKGYVSVPTTGLGSGGANGSAGAGVGTNFHTKLVNIFEAADKHYGWPDSCILSNKDYLSLENELNLPAGKYIIYCNVKIYPDRYICPGEGYLVVGNHVMEIRV